MDELTMLEAKLKKGEETDIGASQHSTKAAVMTGANFGLTYLLARIRSLQPYDNYELPGTAATLEYDIKGILRLEMMHAPAYRSYRRFLGSNFNKRKGAAKGQRFAWRSRILYHLFTDLAGARRFLTEDPLTVWAGSQALAIPEALDPPQPAYVVLFIVHDVDLRDGRRLAGVFADFLSDGSSQTFELLSQADVLAPAPIGGAVDE